MMYLKIVFQTEVVIQESLKFKCFFTFGTFEWALNVVCLLVHIQCAQSFEWFVAQIAFKLAFFTVCNQMALQKIVRSEPIFTQIAWERPSSVIVWHQMWLQTVSSVEWLLADVTAERTFHTVCSQMMCLQSIRSLVWFCTNFAFELALFRVRK